MIKIRNDIKLTKQTKALGKALAKPIHDLVSITRYPDLGGRKHVILGNQFVPLFCRSSAELAGMES